MTRTYIITTDETPVLDVRTDSEVLRRVLTAAKFNLHRLPDKTQVEFDAIHLIGRLQHKYPDLV